MATLEEAGVINTWFCIFGRAMVTDINGAIEAKANYLAALGLACYIETLGALLRGTIYQKGTEQDPANPARRRSVTEGNFNAVLPLLGSAYTKADAEVRRSTSPTLRNEDGLYDLVRNGLVHRYLLKVEKDIPQGGVARAAELRDEGVFVENDAVSIVLRTFARDFDFAMDKIREELLKVSAPPAATLEYMAKANARDRASRQGGAAISGAGPWPGPGGQNAWSGPGHFPQNRSGTYSKP